VSEEEPRLITELITEVPAHIRHQSAPPPVRPTLPTDDHDGRTVVARAPQPSALRQPTGVTVPAGQGAVLGRRPAPIPGGEPWPHLVELPADLTHLSRAHLLVDLAGDFAVTFLLATR
jgi:hypothetical protein